MTVFSIFIFYFLFIYFLIEIFILRIPVYLFDRSNVKAVDGMMFETRNVLIAFVIVVLTFAASTIVSLLSALTIISRYTILQFLC